jgi:hypothetical protein
MSDVAQTLQHRGARWPVTAAWHAANTVPFPHLAELTRDELRVVQDHLLRKSEETISERLGGASADEIAALPESVRRRLAASSLTPSEHALLRAANNHYDVRTAIDYLAGRPLSDFGFEHADQVHGNLWHAGCGCKLHRVFDHNRRFEDWSQSNARQIHPHYAHTVCEVHAPYADDLELLHRAAHEHPAKPAERA